MSYRIPSTRPVIRDRAVDAFRPDRAGLTRQFMEQQTFDYANAVRHGPHDSTFWNNANSPASGYPLAVQNWVGGAGPSAVDLAHVFVPPSGSYANNVIVTFYISDAGGGTIRLSVTSAATGAVKYFDAVDASAPYVTLTVPVDGSDVLTLRVEDKGGMHTNAYVYGYSAHWEPLDGVLSDVTIDATWPYWISQGYHADGVADHAHILKWLQRKAAQLHAHRPKQIAAKWWGTDLPGFAGTFPGWYDSTTVTRDLVVGRYRVYVGEHTPSFDINLFAKATGSGVFNLKVYVNGVLQATIAVSSATYAWVSATISAGFTKAAVNEIRIDTSITVTSGTCVLKLATVSAWENEPTNVQLGLPGADTIPAAFGPCDSRLIKSRSAIAFDLDPYFRRVGRKWLVRGLVYLAARRMRMLINDCRYGDVADDYGKADLVAADNTIQAVYKFRTGPGVSKLRVKADWIWFQWSTSTLSNLPYVGKVEVVGVGTYNITILHGDPHPWVTNDIPVAASTTYEVRFSFTAINATYNAQGRVKGLSIYEVPLTEGDISGL